MAARIPGDDPRRRAPAPMHRLSILHYLKLLIPSDGASITASGNSVRHPAASLSVN